MHPRAPGDTASSEVPKKCESDSSPKRVVLPLRSRRASHTVSTTGAATRLPVRCTTARSRNAHVEPCVVGDEDGVARECEEPADREVGRRRPPHVARPMPVSAVTAAGTSTPGLTRVSNVSPSSSASTRWAPISTMRERAGDSPVVSRSKTTNDAASSGARLRASRPAPRPHRATPAGRRRRRRRRGATARWPSAPRSARRAIRPPRRPRRAVARLDKLDEPVGGVERELHPRDPTRTYVRVGGPKRGPHGPSLMSSEEGALR